MKLTTLLFAALLFVALTPGVFFTLPIKTSSLNIAIGHGLIFAAILYIVVKLSHRVRLFEYFEDTTPTCGNGYQFMGGMGKCFNRTTKKLSAPICPDDTEFDPASSMCLEI